MEEKAKLQELGASHPLTEEQNVLFHRPIQHGSEHKRLQGFDHKALEDLLMLSRVCLTVLSEQHYRDSGTVYT